jgi:aminomethyltransferase
LACGTPSAAGDAERSPALEIDSLADLTPPDPQFNGAPTILPQLAKPSTLPRRRVGFAISKGGAAREGADITTEDGSETLGTITSGLPSPTLGGQNIAMGYVRNGWHKKGTKVGVKVRGKVRGAEVVGMPFVESRFYRKG